MTQLRDERTAVIHFPVFLCVSLLVDVCVCLILVSLLVRTYFLRLFIGYVISGDLLTRRRLVIRREINMTYSIVMNAITANSSLPHYITVNKMHNPYDCDRLQHDATGWSVSC